MIPRTLVLALLAAGLASCRAGVLDPQGPVGKAERLILLDATSIMLAVAIPVILLTLVVVWWFRSGNRRALYRPEWEYSGSIELVVWSIPALVILFLGGIAWQSAHELDPPRALDADGKTLEIQVVSLDWRWLFIYPDSELASVDRVVVPVGTPVRFRLTSASVMNSFFVPQLGSQIYTMYGMTTQLHLQADREGAYQGLSAQFSGEGFSDMRFDFVAVGPAAFDQWIAGVKGQGGALDAAAYRALAQPSTAKQIRTFGSVAPGLFDDVVSGHIAASSPSQSSH